MGLLLGLATPAQAINEPPTGAPDLRNDFASLSAVAGVPEGFKVDFLDQQNDVLLRSITVLPTGGPENATCRVLVRINNLLAKVLVVEPPGQIAGIDQPPSGAPAQTWKAIFDRVGIVQPPSGIVFTPSDTLKVELASVPTGKDKDKNNTCAADVLILGTTVNGQ